METERVGKAGPTRLLFVPFRDKDDVIGYPIGHATFREGSSASSIDVEGRLLRDVVLHHVRDGVSLQPVAVVPVAQVRDPDVSLGDVG